MLPGLCGAYRSLQLLKSRTIATNSKHWTCGVSHYFVSCRAFQMGSCTETSTRVSDTKNDQVRITLSCDFQNSFAGVPEPHRRFRAAPDLRTPRNDFLKLIHHFAPGAF